MENSFKIGEKKIVPKTTSIKGHLLQLHAWVLLIHGTCSFQMYNL